MGHGIDKMKHMGRIILKSGQICSKCTLKDKNRGIMGQISNFWILRFGF
jgi:hypothetical protein